VIDEKELSREEQFWDSVGSKWLRNSDSEDLHVGRAGRFLSGSEGPFQRLLERVGPLQDLRVLDYGCGSGWLSTYFAQRGANVEGFDISGKLVELGMKRALLNGVGDRVHLRKMIAEKLEYPDNHFDRVVGISILHHISLEEGGAELWRVVKPGGSAHFIEPLGESRFQNAVRNYILRVHHGKVRAVDAEHPLTYKDIRTIGSRFRTVDYTETQLAEMIARFTGDGFVRTLRLQALDTFLLRRFPSLKKQCRIVVITYQK
jgi:2-polyprenyl-3-methyl-5-hydroxy-6-metoxy-1,4-benzoquinol methylase